MLPYSLVAQKAVLDAVHAQPGAGRAGLLALTGLPPTALGWHLKRLRAEGHIIANGLCGVLCPSQALQGVSPAASNARDRLLYLLTRAPPPSGIGRDQPLLGGWGRISHLGHVVSVERAWAYLTLARLAREVPGAQVFYGSNLYPRDDATDTWILPGSVRLHKIAA